MPGKFLDWLFHELETARDFPWRVPRKGIILYPAHIRRVFSFFLKTQHHVVGFSSPQNRIDRFEELAHAVIAFNARAIQPINGSVFACDETVSTRGYVNDDLAHAFFASSRFCVSSSPGVYKRPRMSTDRHRSE